MMRKLSSLVHRVTKRGSFTGVFSLEFKMDLNKQLVFFSCSAGTSVLTTLFDSCFIEAYLPLAFAVQRRIRSIVPVDSEEQQRVDHSVQNSKLWFTNKTMSGMVKGYRVTSVEAMERNAALPSIRDIVLGRIV